MKELLIMALIIFPAVTAQADEPEVNQMEYLEQFFRIGAVEDWEESPLDPDSIQQIFSRKCRTLDSLLNLYTPYDTLSGREGMGTVLEIARTYSSLEIYNRSAEWFSLLKRIDHEGIYAQDEYRGILIAGIRTGDRIGVRKLLSEVEFWDASVKEDLGDILAESLRFLIAAGEDSEFLYGRYLMLKRFLPDVEVDMIHFSILSRQGRWDEAYALINSFIRSVPAEKIDLEKADFMFSGYIRAAILSGNFRDVEPILARYWEYSFNDLSSRLRMLLPHVQLLEGRYGDSERNYREICSDGSETACFWADLLQRYRELINNGE